MRLGGNFALRTSGNLHANIQFVTELDNQEIYLAAVPELNDPMEGMFDVFWKGDEVLWENLIRHYVSCFHYTYVLYTLLKEDKEITWDLIPINDPSGSLRELIGEDREEALTTSVLSEPLIREYIEKLVKRKSAVRPNELALHVDNIHCLISLLVSDHFKSPPNNPRVIAEHEQLLNDVKQRLRDKLEIFQTIQQIEKTQSESTNEVERFCTEALVFLSSKDLTYEYKKNGFGSNRNQQLVVQDFPMGYAREVQKLLYPSFYTACFMEKCESASIWASYGNNHTGICLKYKAQSETIEGVTQHFLPMSGRCTGASRGGLTFGTSNERFYSVKYLERIKHVSVDFFSSLGLLPAPISNRDWYTIKGRRTLSQLGVWDSEKRKAYWDSFMDIATSKLKVWEHEKEHRLVYNSMSFGDIPREQRLFKYRFDDLDGVIFGIRTSREDKLRVIKAVATKCKEHGRSDFKFYQAIYSTESHSIEYRHLSTLRLET